MATWLEAAFGLGDEAEPIAPSPPRQPPEIKSFVCVVAQPTGAPGDLGQTVDCHYIVTDGVLTLCDEHGKGLAATDEHGKTGNTSASSHRATNQRRVAGAGCGGHGGKARKAVPLLIGRCAIGRWALRA